MISAWVGVIVLLLTGHWIWAILIAIIALIEERN
jgi:hypothetical protein